MRPEIVVAEVSDLAERLATVFQAVGQQAIRDRGRFTVALPGGSVASSMFPRLAALHFDWSNTDFFWVDERAVDPADPESNYVRARLLWLDPARVPPGRVHRMPADAMDPHGAAREYADVLRRAAGDPPSLDLVMLGAGPDGHVASLFPGHPALRCEGELVAVVGDAPKPPARRMTLTVPVLTAARQLVVAVFGTEKAAAVKEAIECASSDQPLAAVTRRARRVLLLLDPEAASRLS